MPKTATVTLDGTSYEIPAMTIGQLEEVAVAFDGPRVKIPFEVLRIACRRAVPPIDMNTISPSMDEVGAAVSLILETAGLKDKDANPPTPPRLVAVPTSG